MDSGILLIDKPAGVTSFEVVRRVRRALKVRKVGHLGTLDPFATGLLPLCVGEATKLVPFLMPEPKTYMAQVKLGEETDTQDLTGQVVASSDKMPGPEEVHEAAARLVGEIEQIPPMFSALHYQGERLYKLARRGVVVDLPPRRVVIHRLEVLAVALPLVTLSVTCAAGTYIRTLAADLGKALGCGAHLAGLRRLAVGPFKVEAALPLTALKNANYEEISARLIPLGECLPSLKQVVVEPDQARSLRQGRPLLYLKDDLGGGERVRVLLSQELVAVASVRAADSRTWLTPIRVFCGSEQSTVREASPLIEVS